jgi:hypothetical protein
VIYLRRLVVFALLFPIFIFCLLTWGWIGVAIYWAAVMTAYAIQDWVLRRKRLPPVER